MFMSDLQSNLDTGAFTTSLLLRLDLKVEAIKPQIVIKHQSGKNLAVTVDTLQSLV